MKEKHIVKMFESIPNYDTYSHYNSILEKVFKSNSLKNFIEILKRQKKIKEICLLDQISKIDTNKPIDIYADENSELKNIQNGEEYDIFDENNEEIEHYHIKKDEKTKQKSWRVNTVDLKRKKLSPALDPFKYHPNYNSIYKNVPSFKIIDPNKILSNLDAKSKRKKKLKSLNKLKMNEEISLLTETKTIFNKKNNNNNVISNIKLSKTPSKNKKILNTISNINSSDRVKDKSTKFPKLIKLTNNKIIDSINSDTENHALRFSKYISRKYFIKENNKIVSYLDPIDYIKPKSKTKSIDFDKMLRRNEKSLLYAECLKNPSFCQYNPKYTYIDKNEKVRLFNPIEKDFLKNKKYLMRKLWASYKVNSEYQLVDNNKINN